MARNKKLDKTGLEQVWAKITEKFIGKKTILTTKEQISANTSADNIAGALAAKAMMADYNNQISQINSNLEVQILDLTTQVEWQSGITYCPQKDQTWYYSNKIYKWGRICFLSLDIDASNNQKLTDRATICFRITDSKYQPIALLNSQVEGSGYIFVTSGNLYVQRDIETYPTWADTFDSKNETGVRIWCAYISKN